MYSGYGLAKVAKSVEWIDCSIEIANKRIFQKCSLIHQNKGLLDLKVSPAFVNAPRYAEICSLETEVIIKIWLKTM